MFIVYHARNCLSPTFRTFVPVSDICFVTPVVARRHDRGLIVWKRAKEQGPDMEKSLSWYHDKMMTWRRRKRTTGQVVYLRADVPVAEDYYWYDLIWPAKNSRLTHDWSHENAPADLHSICCWHEHCFILTPGFSTNCCLQLPCHFW